MAITLDGTTGITTPSLSGPLNGTVGATTPSTGAFTSVRATSLVSTGTSQTAGANQLALVQSGATSILVSYGAGVGSGNRGAYDFYQSDSAAGNIQIPLSISSAGAVSALTTFAAGTTIGVGGATPSASGAGITFPATASLSSNANTLDDYEEGNWTPTLAFGGNSVGITFVTSYNNSSYTKIGSRVFVSGITILTSKGSSTGNATLKSLPFPPSGVPGFSAVTLGLGGVTFTGQYFADLDANDAVINFGQVTTAGVQSALTNTNFSNSSTFTFSFSYFTSS